MALVGVAAAALTGAGSGCGGVPAPSSPAVSPPNPDTAVTCRSYHFPFPKATASLSGADSGRTVAVPVGGLVAVNLIGSAGQRWDPIQLSGDGLVALANPAQAATVGTRLGEYCVAGSGTSTLTSRQGGQSWSVTVQAQ